MPYHIRDSALHYLQIAPLGMEDRDMLLRFPIFRAVQVEIRVRANGDRNQAGVNIC